LFYGQTKALYRKTKGFYNYSGELEAKGIKMGGDKLFTYLPSEHLLVSNHKKNNSRDWMRKYPNCY
jgi:hypothetical protein